MVCICVHICVRVAMLLVQAEADIRHKCLPNVRVCLSTQGCKFCHKLSHKEELFSVLSELYANSLFSYLILKF